MLPSFELNVTSLPLSEIWQSLILIVTMIFKSLVGSRGNTEEEEKVKERQNCFVNS